MNIWLKSSIFSLLLILIRDNSKNNMPVVLSSPNWVIKAISNCFQDEINLATRLKNHVDAFPTKVYDNNLQTTCSCSTFISLRERINYLIWYSGKTSLSIWNFCRSFSGCLGRGCWSLGTAIASTTSQGRLDAIKDPKLKFGVGDEMVVQGGFFSRHLGGLERPAWALKKMWDILLENWESYGTWDLLKFLSEL